MLDNLLQGFGKGSSNKILLILAVIFLFSGGLDGIFGDNCDDGGFDSNILLILAVIFLMGDFF